jgi:hypothetical protein
MLLDSMRYFHCNGNYSVVFSERNNNKLEDLYVYNRRKEDRTGRSEDIQIQETCYCNGPVSTSFRQGTV